MTFPTTTQTQKNIHKAWRAVTNTA